MSWKLKVIKCPTDPLALTNCAIVSQSLVEANCKSQAWVKALNGQYLFTLRSDSSVPNGAIAFSGQQRKWIQVSLNEEVEVVPWTRDPKRPLKDVLASITFEVEFLNKNKTTKDAFNTDRMAVDFNGQFANQAFTVGQDLAYRFADMDKFNLIVRVKELEVFEDVGKSRRGEFGLLAPNSSIIFEKAEGSFILLTGKSKGKPAFTNIINPEWDFTRMGIGGLDNEFSAIFRRAFASRVFPPEIVDQLGIRHCRGILLFGPPGTGKTLMARTIGKMLNAREPKIVNGPQILDKYVGESEANVRKLFADAEEEEKRCGLNSGLHIIIFDEIDAICKQRGSVAGSSSVHDTVVNQLLAKMDGVEQLNNILVIGMTNRRDMIDEALMRPGRLEIQMEIGLPNEHGRLQILNIHTHHLSDNQKLSGDVSLNELAALTKNFSGAELEGLVRAATSTAMNKLIKATSKVEVDANAIEKMQVTRQDFLHALDTDIKPAFGVSDDELSKFARNGIVNWGDPVARVLHEATLLSAQVKNSDRTPLVSVLLEGPPGSGKTALAVEIAKNSQMPYLKICTPEKLVGYHEAAKCQYIKKIFDDAYRSQMSCIIVDDIEGLLDYVSIGPRFSNLALQALRVLLRQLPPANRKLMVIGTTSQREVLREMDLLSCFSDVIHISNIRTAEELVTALDSMSIFSMQDLDRIQRKLAQSRLQIGIKQLIMTVEMARQADEGQQAYKLLNLLEEKQYIIE